MQNQKITIEVIESKEFHVAARGYSQPEVDEFLDSICDEIERMEVEMDALRTENERLKNQAVPQPVAAPVAAPAPAANTADGTFREILEMAQRVKEQTIADAQVKAAEIIRNAEDEVRTRLGNLTEEKEALEGKLAELRGSVQEYKARVAGLLNDVREMLEADDL